MDFKLTTTRSLAEECTPLKKRYDACFNLWFEGYLQPALDAAAQAQRGAFPSLSDGSEEKQEQGEATSSVTRVEDVPKEEVKAALKVSRASEQRAASSKQIRSACCPSRGGAFVRAGEVECTQLLT